ncbi:hypothetical protein BDW67DRAFT_164947 [Aspergillus spinulosporus]
MSPSHKTTDSSYARSTVLSSTLPPTPVTMRESILSSNCFGSFPAARTPLDNHEAAGCSLWIERLCRRLQTSNSARL